MRVVSGSAKGRRLLGVPGDSTRPILDRVKTALFDILRPGLQGVDFLDLFGGSGSVGIEALSQGATSCVFLDIADKAVKTIRQNLNSTDLAPKAEVRHSDAFSYLRSTKRTFDIVYVAPPQFKGLWIQAVQMIAERPSLVKEGGLVIVQIDPTEYESMNLTEFKETSNRRYGNTCLVFFERTLSAGTN